nr:MAG TPA: hypothetical protein [Caudoviricetes sp.]
MNFIIFYKRSQTRIHTGFFQIYFHCTSTEFHLFAQKTSTKLVQIKSLSAG